jgi:hypothetical protein
MTLLQDEVNVFPSKERLNPILERFKQSSFQPDIQSYITLDARIYEDKTYWLELHAKYFDTEMEIFLHTHHGELDEAMRYLKSLNQLTSNMIDFMKRHDLSSPVEIE